MSKNAHKIDEIQDYLSTKLNRIFYEREFIECVDQDLDIVLRKTECCVVVVFPPLTPIYLKALRYQAKIYDLAVFHLDYGSIKVVAVCHKDYCIDKTKPKETMPPVYNPKHKRPERELYVPPAQRRTNARKIEKTKGTTRYSKLKNLNDLVDSINSLNLIPFFWTHHIDTFIHSNCRFQKLLLNGIQKPTNLTLIYDLNQERIVWNYYKSLKFIYPEIKSNFKLYPNFGDFLLETKDNSNIFLLNFQDDLLINFNANDMYKITCDEFDVDKYDIIDLSNYDLGHYFYYHFDDCDYVFQCQEKHDIVSCYKKQFESIKLKNVQTIELKNKTIIDNMNKLNNETINETIYKNENNKKKDDHEEEKEIMRKTKERINRRIRPIMKYVENTNDTLNIDSNDSLNNWEDLFDEEGKIQEEFLPKVKDKVSDKDMTILKAKEDYSLYTNKPTDDLEHVVELYNFPSTLETHDLVQAFRDINSDAMYIKWVDDTHALLVLGSSIQAQKAIDMTNPLIKVRPMTAASSISKDVASRSDLKPAIKRPPTNLQTARRLITTHLGTKSRVNKEQIAKEKQDLKDAKELKKISRQNERDAWEGNIKSTLKNKN